MAITASDLQYLKLTLKFAKKGEGFASPNPMVGAILVKGNKIIGKGYFHGVGLFHAEVEAIMSAKSSVRGATLYVNLEPHCFQGRTPPCTRAIIKAGIKRVVSITIDPNPRVRGKGFEDLRQAGVRVDVGGPVDPARALNEAYFIYYKHKRPFIALKWANSLDGKIATRNHDSKWITNDEARSFARKLRGKYQAILVGSHTVAEDDPHLGARGENLRDPIRIILDSHLTLPLKAKVLRDKNVIIATTQQAKKVKLRWLKNKGYKILTFSSKHIPLKKLLKELFKLNIISILIEGGGEVHGAFVDNKLFDKVYTFLAPKIIGGKGAVSSVAGTGVAKVRSATHLTDVQIKKFGDNFLIEGYA